MLPGARPFFGRRQDATPRGQGRRRAPGRAGRGRPVQLNAVAFVRQKLVAAAGSGGEDGTAAGRRLEKGGGKALGIIGGQAIELALGQQLHCLGIGDRPHQVYAGDRRLLQLCQQRPVACHHQGGIRGRGAAEGLDEFGHPLFRDEAAQRNHQAAAGAEPEAPPPVHRARRGGQPADLGRVHRVIELPFSLDAKMPQPPAYRLAHPEKAAAVAL